MLYIKIDNERSTTENISKYYHLIDGNRVDNNRSERLVVAILADVVDTVDNIHAGNDLAEDRVLGWSGLVPEVKETVVNSVDEELGSTGSWLTGVGHGEGTRLVTVSWALWVSELVRDGAILGTSDSANAWDFVGGATLWSASTSSGGSRIATKRNNNADDKDTGNK